MSEPISRGKLTISLNVEEGHCGICQKEPVEERLIIDATLNGESFRNVTVCRHCLAEYAPDLLDYIENP